MQNGSAFLLFSATLTTLTATATLGHPFAQGSEQTDILVLHTALPQQHMCCDVALPTLTASTMALRGMLFDKAAPLFLTG